MAKRRTAVATRSNVIVLPAPKRRGRVARRSSRAGSVVRRVGRRARSAAREGALPMGTLLGAVAIGWANGKGWLQKIPVIGGSPGLTLAIAGFALTRISGNATVKSIGRSAMLIGAYDFGTRQAGGAPAVTAKGEMDGDMEGDDFGADADGDFE